MVNSSYNCDASCLEHLGYPIQCRRDRVGALLYDHAVVASPCKRGNSDNGSNQRGPLDHDGAPCRILIWIIGLAPSCDRCHDRTPTQQILVQVHVWMAPAWQQKM